MLAFKSKSQALLHLFAPFGYCLKQGPWVYGASMWIRWLIIILPALLLAYAVYVWMRRAAFSKQVDEYECPLCSTPLDEALFDDLGRITQADLDQLDAFQQKYASTKIRCGNCGGILLCADNGTPMRGYYESN